MNGVLCLIGNLEVNVGRRDTIKMVMRYENEKINGGILPL